VATDERAENIEMNSPDHPEHQPSTRIDSAHPISRSNVAEQAAARVSASNAGGSNASRPSRNDGQPYDGQQHDRHPYDAPDGLLEHGTAVPPHAAEDPELKEEGGFTSLEMQQHVLDQANQLAAHLRSRQRELDRREATLHTQIASLENENRLSRLWFHEQQHEHQQAAKALQAQQQELEARAADLAAAGMAMDEEFTQNQTETDSQLLLIESRALCLDRREKQIAATQQETACQAAHTRRRAALVNMLAELAAAVPAHSLEAVRESSRQIKIEKISLAGYSAELERRAEAVHEQEVAQQAYEAQLQQQAAELQAAQEDITAREAALEDSVAAITAHACDLDHRALDIENRASIYAEKTTVEELQRWRGQLQAREDLLTKQLAEANAETTKLQQQRELFEQQQAAAKAELASSRDEQQRRYDAKSEKLQNRERSLDERSEALHQMEATVATSHRETLEMRLVTQQLWTRLTGIAPPGELTSSLAQIRGRLSDHFRMASSGLEKQKEELLELSGRLDQRQEQLRMQRIEVQEWVARRHEEIEEQAARLVAREQELEAEQRRFDKAGQAMQHQHRQQQLELRQLLSGSHSVA